MTARVAALREVPLLTLVVAAAWLVAVAAELTGTSILLHHHTLIESGPPLWLAIPAFLAAWQVMVAAMMLPGSAPAIAAYGSAARAEGVSQRRVASFVLAYFWLWALFGLAAFLGDYVVHRVVDATPWLGQRQWLIQAGVIGLAGAYQLLPVKRVFLAACRHPMATAHTDRAGFNAGVAHGIDCLGSSWAVMLLMFGAGFANVWWMLGLTGVMVYEARGHNGLAAANIAGVVLLALAGLALALHGLPGFEPA